MSENERLLDRFGAWLLSTDRLPATVALRRSQLERLARVVDLATVDRDGLEVVLAASRHLAPETRKSQLAAWRLFFEWAASRGVRQDRPTDGIEKVRVRRRLPRLAADEAIIAALATASPRDRALISLARLACLRLSEISALHMDDRIGRVLRIRGKGDKERAVYINDDLMVALVELERRQSPGYYFPGRTGPHLHPQSVNKIIHRATGCNPHSLRHAGATAAYRATRDLRAVQEMLGHASLAMTERYLHLNEDARRAVAAATALPTQEGHTHER